MPSQMSTALQKLKILGENIAALVYRKRGTRFMYNEATLALFISINFVQNFTQMMGNYV